MINVEEKGGLMPALKNHLTTVYVPYIKAMENWGKLSETPQGNSTRKEFVDSLDSFVQFIDSK